MSSPIHFYITFNPHLNSYNDSDYTQAHEFYELLKTIVENNPKGVAYWGKMIGKDRDSNFSFKKFNNIIQENLEEGHSTHLYISDFKSIWVGKVAEVVSSIESDELTLAFYKDKKVEAWFKISDFTLLEYTHETCAAKLGELYIDNEHMDFKIDELSPFTSAIRYPAFIQDLSEEMYFDENDHSEFSHLVLQNNHAINSSISLQVMKSLNMYAINEATYAKIPHAAKVEIESAELDMLELRHHNLGRIAFSYIKALEIILNDLVIHHLKKSGAGNSFFVKTDCMPPRLYLDDFEEDGLVPISKFKKNYSINQLIYFVTKARSRKRLDFLKAFSDKKQFVKYVVDELPKVIKENSIIEIRGILAHGNSDEVSEEDARAVRNLILGIGRKGVIQELYQSFFSEFRGLASVKGTYGNSKTPTVSSQKKKPHLKIAS